MLVEAPGVDLVQTFLFELLVARQVANKLRLTTFIV